MSFDPTGRYKGRNYDPSIARQNARRRDDADSVSYSPYSRPQHWDSNSDSNQIGLNYGSALSAASDQGRDDGQIDMRAATLVDALADSPSSTALHRPSSTTYASVAAGHAFSTPVRNDQSISGTPRLPASLNGKPSAQPQDSSTPGGELNSLETLKRFKAQVEASRARNAQSENMASVARVAESYLQSVADKASTSAPPITARRDGPSPTASASAASGQMPAAEEGEIVDSADDGRQRLLKEKLRQQRLAKLKATSSNDANESSPNDTTHSGMDRSNNGHSRQSLSSSPVASTRPFAEAARIRAEERANRAESQPPQIQRGRSRSVSPTRARMPSPRSAADGNPFSHRRHSPPPRATPRPPPAKAVDAEPYERPVRHEPVLVSAKSEQQVNPDRRGSVNGSNQRPDYTPLSERIEPLHPDRTPLSERIDRYSDRPQADSGYDNSRSYDSRSFGQSYREEAPLARKSYAADPFTRPARPATLVGPSSIGLSSEWIDRQINLLTEQLVELKKLQVMNSTTAEALAQVEKQHRDATTGGAFTETNARQAQHDEKPRHDYRDGDYHEIAPGSSYYDMKAKYGKFGSGVPGAYSVHSSGANAEAERREWPERLDRQDRQDKLAPHPQRFKHKFNHQDDDEGSEGVRYKPYYKKPFNKSYGNRNANGYDHEDGEIVGGPSSGYTPNYKKKGYHNRDNDSEGNRGSEGYSRGGGSSSRGRGGYKNGGSRGGYNNYSSTERKPGGKPWERDDHRGGGPSSRGGYQQRYDY